MEKLEEYFLQYATDFSCENFVEDFEGKNVLKDSFLIKRIMSILDEYDEYQVFDSLVNKLAWRDFKREHSENEIVNMSKKNGGYFGVEINEYEERYWKEFENFGVKRLEIVENKNNRIL